MRIDRSVTPTMAKIATLAHWELDRLRTIERVVRLGHIMHVKPGRLMLAYGEVGIARDAVVVHCAARGLRYPPLVPVWGPEAITLQTIRNTYACFGPALAGYVEARVEDDAEKNRMCPPVPFSNTTADWARQQVLGARASFTSHPSRRGVGRQRVAQPGPRPAGAGQVSGRDRRRPAVPSARGSGLAMLAALAEMHPLRT